MSKADRMLEQAVEHLDPGEEVLAHARVGLEYVIEGSDSYRTGLAVATDRRFVFYRKKPGGYDFEYYAYGILVPFGHGKGLTGRTHKYLGAGNPFSMIAMGEDEELAEFTKLLNDRLARS